MSILYVQILDWLFGGIRCDFNSCSFELVIEINPQNSKKFSNKIPLKQILLTTEGASWRVHPLDNEPLSESQRGLGAGILYPSIIGRFCLQFDGWPVA